MASQRKTLFPDTNYFLHHPPIDQVDWLRTADAESVVICVCMQVIHELDNKTYDPRLKDRAKRVNKELRNIRKNGNTVRPNVTLELLSEDPRDELFRAGLNPGNNDDRILQCTLNRKEAFPLEEIEVVSEDFGMEIKCANLHITLLKPDPDKRLPDLEAVQLRQLRQTQEELQKHKNALPDLTLSFRKEEKKSTSHLTFSLPSSSPINLAEEMISIRRRYPLRGPETRTSSFVALESNFLMAIRKEEHE